MEPDVFDALNELTGKFRARLHQSPALQEFRLTGYQARLLFLAARNPGWSQQMLAVATERDKAQVARALKDLEARGLVTRSVQATDIRAHGVVVTEEGLQVARRLYEGRRVIAEAVLATLTPAEQEVLGRLVHRLLSTLAA